MHRIKRTLGEKIFDRINLVFMLIIIFITLTPFIIVLSSSFASTSEYLEKGGLVLFPSKIDISAYKFAFSSNSLILNAYIITLFRTIFGTVLCLFFTSLASYTVSKKNLPGRNILMIFILIPMLFYGGLIPYYLIVRDIGLYNNIWVLIFPVLVSPWYLIIMRNFFMEIPASIEESARIDGANDILIFFRIIIPLSKAVIMVIGLFYAVLHWNSWFDAIIFITNRKLWPVQVILRNVLHQLTIENLLVSASVGVEILPPRQSVKMATIIIVTVPIICVYPFIQKHFMKGILIGSIKG